MLLFSCKYKELRAIKINKLIDSYVCLWNYCGHWEIRVCKHKVNYTNIERLTSNLFYFSMQNVIVYNFITGTSSQLINWFACFKSIKSKSLNHCSNLGLHLLIPT